MATTWDDLRKEARKLENEIDAKVVSFTKLASAYSQKDHEQAEPNGGSPEHVFDTMVMELDQRLEKLRDVNGSMNDYVSKLASPGTLYHTLQRHNDILQDYSQEFNRTKANIQAIRQRNELLGSSRRDAAGSFNGGLNRRTEMYLKEHDHLRNSERMVDDAISIAMATKENLTGQRNMFKGVTSKMQNITHTFPLINSLVQRINLRRRRDSLILGGVIAACIIILLFFIFR